MGNAVSECETTVGAARYDGTLMEGSFTETRCLDITGTDRLGERMNSPPLTQRLGTPLKRRGQSQTERCHNCLQVIFPAPESDGCERLELKLCGRKLLFFSTFLALSQARPNRVKREICRHDLPRIVCMTHPKDRALPPSKIGFQALSRSQG